MALAKAYALDWDLIADDKHRHFLLVTLVR